MCGIVATLTDPRNVDAPALTSTITAMNAALEHRGPDDDGHVALPQAGVALAMRRLSIIDLAGGQQPMWDATRSYCIVFNGEIYNAPALRAELEQLGHSFTTHNSDTEAVVEGFAEWGTDLFRRLNGMFALAIWDEALAQLVVARDRAGQKPLYIAKLSQGIAIASELKAFREHPEFEPTVDPIALEQYLAFDYILSPRTMLDGVQKLPAGCFALLSADEIHVQRYWTLAFSETDTSPDSVMREFDDLLDRSVAARMVADVPVGLFLSGGLDSTAVGYYMRRHSDDVQSFSIAFDDPTFDESQYASRAAAHLGTTHHVQHSTSRQLLDILPRIPAILDEPMGDLSIFPTHLLSQFARESVTVALGGDGSDELLMGYGTYKWMKAFWELDRVPRPLRRLAAATTRRAPEAPLSSNARSRFAATLLDRSPEDRLLRALGSYRGDARSVLSPDLLRSLPATPASPDGLLDGVSGIEASPNRTIASYMRGYLSEDILVKVDRASMATSLEVRSPFLDPGLIDFLATVPDSMKLHRLTGKRLLRQTMRGRVPDEVLDRKKQGFGIPIDAWLRDELRPLLDEHLSSDRIRALGFFDADAVAPLVDEHTTAKANHGRKL